MRSTPRSYSSTSPRARERELLLLAARQHARGTIRDGLEPDGIENVARALIALTLGNAGKLQAIGYVCVRRATQHHGPLKHHGLRARSDAVAAATPNDAAGRRGQEPVTQAHQHALAGPVRTQDHGSRAHLELARHAIDDRSAAGDE